MPEINKEVKEPIKTKKQVVQFFIAQFENSESKLVQELVQKAKELKSRLEQEELIKKDLAINEWVRRKIEKIIDELRAQLNQILELEQKELEAKKALTHDALTCDRVYQAACLLTEFWPMNKPYVPGKDEDAGLWGKPSCMITLGVIDPDNRIISSTGDQFDGIALLGWLNRNPSHPKTRRQFNARDSEQINAFAKEKGFTPPLTVSVDSQGQNAVRTSSRGPRLLWASLGLWTLGLILGAVGLSVAVAAAFYMVGSLGILAGSCYMLYQEIRAQSNAMNNREQERRWARYREELDLAQALSLSLQESNNRPVLSRRNEEMDFLYDGSSSNGNSQNSESGLGQSEEPETNAQLSQGLDLALEPEFDESKEVEEGLRMNPSATCNRGAGLRV